MIAAIYGYIEVWLRRSTVASKSVEGELYGYIERSMITSKGIYIEWMLNFGERQRCSLTTLVRILNETLALAQ